MLRCAIRGVEELRLAGVQYNKCSMQEKSIMNASFCVVHMKLHYPYRVRMITVFTHGQRLAGREACLT